MGKSIRVEETIIIPEGVTVAISKGFVEVKGKRGTLRKRLPKAPVLYRNVDVAAKKKTDKARKGVRITMFLANRKRQSCVIALSKFINNLIKGVTLGYEYKLRFGYNILPQRPQAIQGGKAFEISNYMGQKDTHVIKCPEGVIVKNHEDPKVKEIYVSGIDLEHVGQMASVMSQKCLPRKLDRRVFMDGIYIDTRDTIEKLD